MQPSHEASPRLGIIGIVAAMPEWARRVCAALSVGLRVQVGMLNQ